MVAECEVLLYAEFGKGQEVNPVVLLVVDVYPKILFEEAGSIRCMLCQLSSDKATSSGLYSEDEGNAPIRAESLNNIFGYTSTTSRTTGLTFLPLAEFAYNNTSHSATMVTPFFANKGFHPKLEVSLASVVSDAAHSVASDERTPPVSPQPDRTCPQAVRGPLSLPATPDPPFQVGDTVWLDSCNIKNTCPSKKLDHHFLGPFPIVERVSCTLFGSVCPWPCLAIHPVFHVSLLQPTSSSNIPDRVVDLHRRLS